MKNYLLTLNTIDENCKTFSSEATQRCRNAPKKTKTTLASRLFCSRWWLYHQFNGGKKKFYLLCSCTLTYWAQVHFFRFGKAIIIYQVSRTREGDLPELSPFFFGLSQGYLPFQCKTEYELIKRDKYTKIKVQEALTKRWFCWIKYRILLWKQTE